MQDATPLASPVYAPGAPEAPGTSAHAAGNHALLVKAMAAHQKSSNGANPDITNGFYDPTDIYNSNAYNYNALQALGHCCNPNSNPGSSPPEASIAIATFGDIAGSDITGFHNQYPYLAYNYNTFTLMEHRRAATTNQLSTQNGLRLPLIVSEPKPTQLIFTFTSERTSTIRRYGHVRFHALRRICARLHHQLELH